MLQNHSRLATHGLQLIALLGCGLLSGCTPFEHRWADANDAHFPEDDVSGIWVGPWRNDTNGRQGTVKLIVHKTPIGGYQAYMKTFVQHPIWPERRMASGDYPWEMEIPFFAVPREDGTFKVASRFYFTWLNFFDRQEFVCEGVADGSDISGTFRHGAESGQLRLHRLDPCPKQWTASIPGFLSLSYAPPKLREQVFQAENLELHVPNSIDEVQRNNDLLPVTFETDHES